ncbi:MAG: N-formylglutamate amidohydrolase [Alphaproteobacteria bacterium]|nr:N-formylglutamate amidohydrolase [Alphaproteobacteria bacterium]
MARLTEKTEPPAPALIGPDDPPAFEVVNAEGTGALLLTCDHAKAAIPKAMGRLGLDANALLRHIAWDIGAGEMTRALAERLDAPAVLSGYSRLLVDCNRPLDSESAIPEEVDGTRIPGNTGLSQAERAARAEAFYWPYHHAIAGRLDAFRERGVCPAVLSIHSFTPVLDGFERPWQIGVLWERDPRLARPLMEILRTRHRLAVGDNEPYAGRDNYGYTMEHHVVAEGLPQVLIEIRQDLIDTRHGVETWVGILGPALEEILSKPEIFRQEWFA